MKADMQPSPIINLFGHIDSVQQRQMDKKQIEDAIAYGKTDAKNNKEGIYYTMIKEGTGRMVSVNDTVVAYYKGYLFDNGLVFDQTKDKPATMDLHGFIDECAAMQLEGAELTGYYMPELPDRAYLHSLRTHCFQSGLTVSGTAIPADTNTLVA